MVIFTQKLILIEKGGFFYINVHTLILLYKRPNSKNFQCRLRVDFVFNNLKEKLALIFC
jgi:hypothetical protein